MAQELTLKTHHNPSVFNKDMLLGGLLGTVAMPVVGTLIGAIIGGSIGKTNQEKENENGKRVGDPSFWNKDTAIGGLIGSFVGSAIGAVAMFALAAGGAPVLAAAGLAAAGVAWMGATALGAYIGGKAGEKRQAREYEEAKHQTIVNHISNKVSPEVGKAVEYSMEHNKNWAKDVTEERLLAEAQQQIR
jgi:hypothetical protein